MGKFSLFRKLKSGINSLSNAGVLSSQDITALRAYIRKLESALQKNDKVQVKALVAKICMIFIDCENREVEDNSRG